jgi:hypothetical protein
MVGYLLIIAAIVGGLLTARSNAIENFASDDARRAWDDWRRSTESQDQTKQPVERSTPRSSEPPTLVLLRDHFAVCTLASLILSTVLYWTTAIFIYGIATGPEFHFEDQTGAERH